MSTFGFGGFGQSAAGGFGGFGQTQAAGGFGQPAAAPAFGAAKQVQLPKGSSGRVIEIDSDGDAEIQFSGVPGVSTPQWVLKDNFDKLATPKQKVPWKDNLRSALKKATSEWMERKKRKTLHEHLQQRLFAAVKAAWTVEKKTFTDMVMKACRDLILQEHKQWVQTAMFNDKQIRDAAVEESSVASTRAQLKKTIAAMKESLQTLDTIMAKPI